MSKFTKLTDPGKDLSKWYQEILSRAELAEHAAVKGCMVIRPYGFEIWELLRDELNRRIKKRGVKNASFPLFIPISLLEREKDHLEGFSPECAVVTHAGGKDLEEPFVVRPTSEVIIHESMKNWIQSYRDLPMRLNQWANVVRWEKRPRLFLRGTEFHWQEGHTAHETEEEVLQEVSEMLNVYHDFVAEWLCIPTIMGRKSESEKFAGAVQSFSIEGMMPDGKALQMGTVHNLGINFSRMAGVKYLGRDSQEHFVHMTSWGVSTRLMGALIMSHGDAKGLVLPPSIAPVQVVIVPIGEAEEVASVVQNISSQLGKMGIRFEVDDRDGVRPGQKYYYHEMRGVPLRIEVGPRDVAAGKLKCAFRTEEGKFDLQIDAIGNIPSLLSGQQNLIYSRAFQNLHESHIISPSRKNAFSKAINRQEGFIKGDWCGLDECEAEVKEKTGATIRNLPLSEGVNSENCIWCGKPSQYLAYFSRAY